MIVPTATRDALIQIYEDRDKSPFSDEASCQLARRSGTPKSREAYIQHDMIANHVLPYVIYQKDRKFKRRAFGAVPIIGSLESIRGLGNYLYKRAKGTQGKSPAPCCLLAGGAPGHLRLRAGAGNRQGAIQWA